MTRFSRADGLLHAATDHQQKSRIAAQYAGPTPQIIAVSRLKQAILACPRKDACELMLAELQRLTVSMPIAPLFTVMEEARYWSSFSTPDENAAYCAACFNALPMPRKLGFLTYAKRLCDGA